MELKQYYLKNVRVIASNGKDFVGLVDDYFYPEDNEREVESIVLKTKNSLIEFYEDDIAEIKTI